MKALIIFALIALISYSYQSIDDSINYSCPNDKKIKIGEDVCAIFTKDITDSKSIFYIKKKSCGKKKSCNAYGNPTYDEKTGLFYVILTCQKKLKLLKIDKKCNYNSECNTGYCNNGKCATFENCYSNSMCGPSKYCKGFNKYTNTAGTCTDYVKENEVVDTGTCAPGLGKFYDSDSKNYICKKYFSLDKKAINAYNQDIFCKSYFSYDGKCAELIKVDTPENYCSITYDNGDGEKVITGSASSGEDFLYQMIDGDSTPHCLYSTGKKELVNELVKRYNKIKLDKILEKEDCDYGSNNLCDKKYAELNNVYNYYGILKYLNLIKDNGEKNKDKKCEYEFWRSTISSSYVNVCFGFVFALLGLLF